MIGVVTCVAGCVALGWSNARFYEQLVATGRSTEGVVVSTEPSDHNSIHYDYRVNDVLYHGVFSALPPNPPADLLHPGNHVVIVYDRQHPGTSCSCNPVDFVGSEKTFGLVLAVMFSPVIVVVMLVQRRVFRRRETRLNV